MKDSIIYDIDFNSNNDHCNTGEAILCRSALANGLEINQSIRRLKPDGKE